MRDNLSPTPAALVRGFRPLPLAMRAGLFAQLAVLENAGVPVVEALKTLSGPAGPSAHDNGEDLARRAQAAARRVASGMSLARAGHSTGLFSAREATLIQVVSEGGSLVRAYKRLARACEREAASLAKMRARCVLPGFVLLGGLTMAPLPSLLSGDITAGQYVSHVFAGIAAVTLLVWLVAGVRRFTQAVPHGILSRWAGKVTLRLPLLGPQNTRRNLTAFLEELGGLLDAGLPADKAAELAVKVPANPLVRAALESIPVDLRRGRSLGEALAGVPGLSATVHQIVLTGEAAGRIAESIERVVELERAEVGAIDDELAAWFPRIVYFAVIAYLFFGFF